MNNRQLQGIVSLVIVAALSFGIVLGTNALTQQIENGSNSMETEEILETELDVTGSQGILRAGKTKANTYQITSKAQGYGGEIIVDITFDENAKKILNVSIKEQNETQGVGSKVTEEAFLQQFSDIAAPVSFNGMVAETDGDFLENAVLIDGTYEKSWETADENGFTDQVRVVIENGTIQSVTWDSVSEDGQSKSKMSEEGTYQMTQDGLSWAEQAKALGDAVVEDQSLKRITPDYTGKIDTIAGVSISVSNFVSLTRSCLAQAAQIPEQTLPEAKEQEGTAIDGISGATVSSAAVVTAINQAWEFLKENL